MLMPETLKGLWRQRLRWAIGGTQTIIAASTSVLARGGWPMLVIWLNYLVSILWAYAVIYVLVLWFVGSAAARLGLGEPHLGSIPGWWTGVLALTYFCQATLSACLDARFEKGLLRALFWVVWFPMAYWTLSAVTTFVGLPMAILRRRDARGTWISPDRGVR
jgi:biofilm PGA synthesis N-glycosyltransferase PgaC